MRDPRLASRLASLLLPALMLALAGCGSTVEYRDTNAAVDADPLCASRPDRPGEPVAQRCVRETGGELRLGDRDQAPLDLSGRSRREQDPR